MSVQATAIYEHGTLRLLTPVALSERKKVRLQITEVEDSDNDLQRAEAALMAAGLIKPRASSLEVKTVSDTRREELAHLYAGTPLLSEIIIAERDTG
jgi:predicted DNA-binding antitoxin AbrB/MazE fold protein